MTVVEARAAEHDLHSSIDAAAGVAQVDLGENLPSLHSIPPLGVRCLVRHAGRPIGYVDITGPDRLLADALAAAIWDQLGPAIETTCHAVGLELTHPLTEGGLPMPPTPIPAEVEGTMTVVIATHDRPSLLDRCLGSLVSARPAPAGIIVVDNAPSSDRTRLLVEQWAETHPEIRYVLEPQAGLGRAHNAALPHVKTEHVAFTDDDVRVDGHWVGALAQGFANGPNTVCVTGLIAPAELLTQEQWWVERGSGFAKGFDRRVRSSRNSTSEGPLFPFDAGTLGSGANMAFSTAYLRDRGGFDPSLGTGTRSLGGDDLAALHEAIASGYDLVYEPGAIVFHRHHADRAALERQAMGYGAGLTAYLTSAAIRRPAAMLGLARRMPAGLRQVFATSSPLNERRPADYPQSLVWRERAGMVSGPFRYAQQRLSDRERVA